MQNSAFLIRLDEMRKDRRTNYETLNNKALRKGARVRGKICNVTKGIIMLAVFYKKIIPEYEVIH